MHLAAKTIIMSHDHGDHGSSMASDAGMISMGDMFCSGSGTVMLNGFQAASSESARCVLFLFEGAVVDSATKYAFAVMGAFAIGFATEIIRYYRAVLAQKNGTNMDLALTGAFVVQIFLAYALMLLVMLYEYVFLTFIILGLALGYFTTLRLTRARQAAAAANGMKMAPLPASASSGSPCCNNDVCA